MGATDITMRLEGHPSMTEVRKAVREQAEQDSAENGHREGYSGDWQTIDRIRGPVAVEEGGNEANIDRIQELAEDTRKGDAVAYRTTGENGAKVTWVVGLASC